MHPSQHVFHLRRIKVVESSDAYHIMRKRWNYKIIPASLSSGTLLLNRAALLFWICKASSWIQSLCSFPSTSSSLCPLAISLRRWRRRCSKDDVHCRWASFTLLVQQLWQLRDSFILLTDSWRQCVFKRFRPHCFLAKNKITWAMCIQAVPSTLCMCIQVLASTYTMCI